MNITIIGRTDVGQQRKLNEDSFGILDSKLLAVVCDGMGGHAAGEVASATAVDTILNLHRDPELPSCSEQAYNLETDFTREGQDLAVAIRVANSRIYGKASADSNLTGMGTTVVAAVLHDGIVSICHVGDSRAYRIRSGVLKQITSDHSWVGELIEAGQMTKEEARDFPNRNVITRALGVRERVRVDIFEDRLYEGEIFLLCSDGLVECVTDEKILSIITRSGSDLAVAADNLIAAANDGGGHDNITCALIRVNGLDGDETDLSPRTFTFPDETDSELEADRAICEYLDQKRGGAEDTTRNDFEDTDEMEAVDPNSPG